MKLNKKASNHLTITRKREQDYFFPFAGLKINFEK